MLHAQFAFKLFLASKMLLNTGTQLPIDPIHPLGELHLLKYDPPPILSVHKVGGIENIGEVCGCACGNSVISRHL